MRRYSKSEAMPTGTSPVSASHVVRRSPSASSHAATSSANLGSTRPAPEDQRQRSAATTATSSAPATRTTTSRGAAPAVTPPRSAARSLPLRSPRKGTAAGYDRASPTKETTNVERHDGRRRAGPPARGRQRDPDARPRGLADPRRAG